MRARDYIMFVVVCALLTTFLFFVMYGAQALIVDIGRAILSK
jgi:hypothetical protein